MTDEPSILILRARVVLPIRRPPIEDGAVAVEGNRIIGVGRWKQLRARFSGCSLDLGDVILMPGLVNAHCHLDYTDMVGMFPPLRRFCDWIKLITTEKGLWTFTDFAQSWINGAKMLVRHGTTTVADVEAMHELLPDVWETTLLRVVSFLEMTGIRSRRSPEAILAKAVDKVVSLHDGHCAAALSPHAPYSTTPVLMSDSATECRRRGWRLCSHVAESATEFEMFMHGRGEMFDWLRRNERDMSDCGGVSPVQHMAKTNALGNNLLAIHVNYLADGDANLLARKRVNVVHCPRSHDFFGHARFPYTTLSRRGVNVCLGTDSLATVRKKPKQTVELNMFDEMRAFSSSQNHVSSERIVRMATVNGAKALGLEGKVGVLATGAFADIILLKSDGKPADSYNAVVQHTGPVAANMIDGQWAVYPEGFAAS